MKYTIPYDAKINLPHIKELIKLELKPSDMAQDGDDLVGKIMVMGEYSLDQSEEIMNFCQEIPVSLLMDDCEVEPEINCQNLQYEVVKGRGLEIMFDLEVQLPSRDEKFQQEVDEKLCEVLEENAGDQFVEINQSLQEALQSEPVEDVFMEETIEEAKCDMDEAGEERNSKNEEDDDDLEIIEDIFGLDEDNAIEIPVEINESGEVIEVIPEENLKVSPSDAVQSFDVGFIGNQFDKYTTYKIIILDEDEKIDEILTLKNLSPNCIIDEVCDGRKYVLKIEDE